MIAINRDISVQPLSPLIVAYRCTCITTSQIYIKVLSSIDPVHAVFLLNCPHTAPHPRRDITGIKPETKHLYIAFLPECIE